MKKLTIGLIGNPNSGKTTLFNELTKSTQHVGNWSGVTVEQKVCEFALGDFEISLVDLPGIYSITVLSDAGSIDEKVAVEYMLSNQADMIINVVDAANLERNLYLTTQLLELDIPVILAVNMQDVAERRGIFIDVKELSSQLGCHVVSLVANRKKGIDQLKAAILIQHTQRNSFKHALQCYPENFKGIFNDLSQKLKVKKYIHPIFMATRLLEDDIYAASIINEDILDFVKKIKKEIKEKFNQEVDILIAGFRYDLVHEIVNKSLDKKDILKKPMTAVIDNIVLDRIFGIPIFLLVMYCLFWFSIHVGGAFQESFSMTSDIVFVQMMSRALINLHLPSWLFSALVFGVGRGLNTTITFIPVIGCMFLFLSVLEDSGYIARAAFVVDRFMSIIGLPGKSFIPMIIGFGCNVPAIMASRALENRRDRILTIFMTPFMSCGARLAVYAVFTAAFFPENGQNVVFGLYLIGIAIALLTGFILQKTLLIGEQSSLVMELSPYHIPIARNILNQTAHRLWCFLSKAATIVVPVSVLMVLLNTVSFHNEMLLETAGKAITPIFKPMGIQQSNWPATVGLVTGIVAKETVVGTLNTLYSQSTQSNIKPNDEQLAYNPMQSLKSAFMTIPRNLFGLDDKNQSDKKDSLSKIYGKMYIQFQGKIGAFAYLLFVLLYFPCLPAIVAMTKELNWKWATGSVLWTNWVAYSVSVMFFQLFNIQSNPVYAVKKMFFVLIVYIILISFIRYVGKKNLVGRD